MRAPLPRTAFMFRGSADRRELCRWRTGRRGPFISSFIYFPGFRLAAFQAHVASRICRTAESDFVPGIGMCVIRADYILYKKKPEAMN